MTSETEEIVSINIPLIVPMPTKSEWATMTWYPLQQDAVRYYKRELNWSNTTTKYIYTPHHNPYGDIHIIGAGGVGFYLVPALLPLVTNRIAVWDDDNFDGGTGHHRLPDVANPKTPKVKRLAAFLAMEFSNDAARVTFTPLKFLPECPTIQSPISLIVDCSDMGYESRKLIWDAAKAAGIPIVRVSYDKDIITWSDQLPLDVTGRGGYENIPTLANSFAAGGIGASLVAEYVKGNRIPSKTFYIGVVQHVELGTLQTIEEFVAAETQSFDDTEFEGLFDEAGEMVGYVDSDGNEVMFDSDEEVDEAEEEVAEALEIIEDTEAEFEEFSDDVLDSSDDLLDSLRYTFEALPNSLNPFTNARVAATLSQTISNHLTGDSAERYQGQQLSTLVETRIRAPINATLDTVSNAELPPH